MTTPDEPDVPSGPRGSEGLTTRPLPPAPAAVIPTAPSPTVQPVPVEPAPLLDEPVTPAPLPDEPVTPEPEPVSPEPEPDTGTTAVPPSRPAIADDDPLPRAAPEEPADSLVLDPPAPVPRRGRAWLPLTAVGLAVALLAGGTGALAWELRQQDLADEAAVDAVAAARDAARLLFSYDHKTLQADFAKGLAVTTGDFRSQYQRTTKDVVSPVAVQYKAVVKAEVVEAAVIDAQADEVTALVFLNQATTSTRVQGQQVDQSRVRMRLVPRGGRWLVEEVKAL